MRKLVLLLFSTPFVLLIQAGDVLRLMTCNVHNTRGMDNSCNYQRVASMVNNTRLDAVAVQEPDSIVAWSNGTDVLREPTERTQLRFYFTPAIDHDGGKYGIDLLAKEAPLHLQTFTLPGREEARTLIIIGFPEYVFGCTHPSPAEEGRMKSLEVLKSAAVSTKESFSLASDFDPDTGSGFIKELKNAFQVPSNPKQPTYPASEPKGTLDYLIASKQEELTFAVSSARVTDEPLASDHRPLLVGVRMATPKDRICHTKPYLQNPVGSGITVMWQTNVPAYYWMEYSTGPSNLKRTCTLLDGQVVCGDTLHKIRLDSLQPGQKYYYQACSQEILPYQTYKKVLGNAARTELKELTLPADGGDSLTAVVFNGLHRQSKTFQALYSQIEGVGYDFAVFSGDCVDDPADHDQATASTSELTEGAEGDHAPIFLMRDNHEIRNTYSVRLHSLPDYVDDRTRKAFNWGDMHIVILDCGEDKPDDHWVYHGLNNFTELCSDRVGFLRKELTSKEFKKTDKRILIHRVPLYGNDYENLCSGPWGEFLEKAPFNACLDVYIREYAYHPKDGLGNNFPIIISGGYSMKSATVVVIEKKRDVFRVRVLNTQGEVLLELAV